MTDQRVSDGKAPDALATGHEPDRDVVSYWLNGREKSKGLEPQRAIELLFGGADKTPATAAAPAKHGALGFVWMHCHIESPWLARMLGEGRIDQLVFDQLSDADTRPMCIPHSDGLLFNLRGKALVSVKDENELVAVRSWIVKGGVITCWRRQTRAARDLLAEVTRGYGPKTPGDLIARLALRMVDSIEPMVDDLSEVVDDLEIEVVAGGRELMRREMAELRRDAIDLRRFLYPQRDALSTILIERAAFLKEKDRIKLHDAHNSMARFIEELEVTRERVAVLHDEIIDNRSEQMNKQMLLLSIVSAVFLPASLVAGLLGMNVEGIPFATHPGGFWIICGITLAIVVAELILFRWLKIY